MKLLRLLPFLLLLLAGAAFSLRSAESQEGELEIDSIGPGEIFYDYEEGHFEEGFAVITNRFVARYKDAVLTAQGGQVNLKTGDAVVEGAVHLQRENQVWSGERLQYNFL